MRSINKVTIIGNLTRDPEMRITPNDQHITTFGVATNREWITQDGRKEQSTEFHDIVCWGRLADRCNDFLKKGKLVYIEGYLKTRSWDDTNGLKRFRTEIVAEEVIMLDRRPRSEMPMGNEADAILKESDRPHGDLDMNEAALPEKPVTEEQKNI